MKRYIACLMMMILITVPYAKAESTKRRELYEFQSLYEKRLLSIAEKYDDYNIDTRTTGIKVYGRLGDEMTVSTGAGLAKLDDADLTITQLDMIWAMLSPSYDLDLQLFQCIAGMSVLEYGKTGRNAISMMEKEFFENGVDSKITSAISEKSEDEILVYDGNYQYYIAYFCASDGTEVYFLTAKAK